MCTSASIGKHLVWNMPHERQTSCPARREQSTMLDPLPRKKHTYLILCTFHGEHLLCYPAFKNNCSSKSKDSLSWPFWLGFQYTNCIHHCVEVKGIILFDVENKYISNLLSLFIELNNKIIINREFCISSLLEKAFELSGIVMYQVTWRWMEWINSLDQLTVTNNWSRHMYQYQTNTNQNCKTRIYFSIVNNVSKKNTSSNWPADTTEHTSVSIQTTLNHGISLPSHAPSQQIITSLEAMRWRGGTVVLSFKQKKGKIF